jgi:cytoskeletal protein CcmA (bactofilin family)
MRCLVILLFVLLGCGSVWADEDDDDDKGHRGEEDHAEAVIAGDFFGAGASSGPDGSIEGDAFVAGGEVIVSAPVMGDAVLSGGSIHVGDYIGSDLYAGGGNIVVDAAVGHNTRLAGGRIHITRHADIAGNATLAGSNLLMEGRIGGAFSAFGESVTINGEVGGGATVVARSLEVGPNARINGRLKYRTANPPKISSEAIISGGVEKSELEFPRTKVEPVAKAIAWVGVLMFSAGLFVVGALIILSIPDAATSVTGQIRSRPFGALLVGFALIVCVPVAAILAFVSVIGIPIGFLLMFMWPIIVMIGYLAGVLFLGDMVAALFTRDRTRSTNRGMRVLGLAIVLAAAIVLVQIPILGAMLILALLFLGAGALAFSIRELV